MAIAGLERDNMEQIQFLRYKPGEYFQSHYDYFSPERSDSADQLRKGGQRVCSLFVFLNTIPTGAGGETHFTKLGLKFRPVCGRAIFWWNVLPDGTEDQRTMHQGLPPTCDLKYALNIWFRENSRK